MTPATKRHILVIDDNLANLQVTARILKDHGYFVSLALSGQAGISQLDIDPPELILLDIMMPEMSGLEACRIIKQNKKWKDIPIIFLTAKGETQDLVDGFKAGGVDYIIKPFVSDELLVRMRNQIELSDSKKKIIEMNRTRDKLYSIIAHDIRSPFSSIAQTLEAIDLGYFDVNSADFKEMLSHLNARVKETSTLLNSLLDWTLQQGEAVNVQIKNYSLSSMVKSCVQLLSANAQSKQITINQNIDPKMEVLCDEVMMHTVFRNIISNAIKFTPKGGNINISSQLMGNYVEIQFKDSGIGMSAETIQKIFEKGEHHTSSGTNDEMGTGLGLIMVKDFVEKTKGKIKVESALGEGTKFTVSLLNIHL